MVTEVQAQQRSLLVVVVAAVTALGLIRFGLRLGGLAVLTAVVAGTVGVLAVGIVVLRILVG